MKKLIFFVAIVFLSFLYSCTNKKQETNTETQNDSSVTTQETALSGAYFGQKLPTDAPELFAPEVISNCLYNRDVAMPPDGSQMYFGVLGRSYAMILQTKLVDGVWTKPDIAPFSGNQQIFDLEPHIAPDGKRFFFLSTRPNDGSEPKAGWTNQDIWVMDKLETGDWSEPYNLGAPVNSAAPEFFPSVTTNGTIYFTRETDGEQASFIFRSRLVDGKYQEPEKLPAEVNSQPTQYNACIAPDESFIIVCTSIPAKKIGFSDYYVSFRSKDDKWSELINMGEPVNMPNTEASSPYITPDGKYFFFSSTRKNETSDTERHNYQNMLSSWCKAQNGMADIYWMKADFIQKLRPETHKIQ